MARVRQYPEETPAFLLEQRVAVLEGIIRARFAEGSGQIDTGNSTEVITHTLMVVPSSVFVTPKDNGILMWVSAVGATTFTVNRSGTSGDRTFYWLAIPEG